MHGFTDASSKGIGIVVGNKWQWWSFNQESDLLPRSSATNEIDPNWAELLAVYMFLITQARAGRQGCRITLRSDSAMVVGMFERHAATHPSLWGVPKKERERHRGERYRELLRRIGGLVAKHRLDVVIKWVPRSENLADSPSRGKGLLEKTRLRYGADVPGDLVGVLVSA